MTISSSSINEEVPSFGGRRDRSYSIDHTNASHHNPTDITMGTGTAMNKANAPHNKMQHTAKRHLHHHGNRRRSKSCDMHRHSPSLQKKKYPTHHHHHHSRTHSPIHHDGRVSPKLTCCSHSSPKYYRGKMWIRPVAVRALASVPPYSPADATTTKEHQVEIVGGVINGSFAASSAVFQANKSPTVFRQVAQSPVFDDDMMLYTSPNSSFEADQKNGSTISPRRNTRIIFGESGKPIKPRNSFVDYSSAATTLYRFE